MSLNRSVFKNAISLSLFLAMLFIGSGFLQAQDVNFRVMTYNGLKLDGTDTDRQSAFQTVLEASNPDILLMQEIVDASGADLILNALNAQGTQYSRATFLNGVDTDNMLFYRTSIGTLISQNEIPTTLREISEYVMQIGDNEIRFYSAHLKASSGSTNEQRRLDEVTVLRNHLNNLPAGTEFVIVGDFNIYDSAEPAYQKFLANESDNDGRAEDPLATTGGVGDWHINPAFAAVHTQSPRTTQFGGGAHGGMDDRFDFILTSFGINDNADVELIEGSYTAFGNDGNHFDTSILDGPNSAVSATVAQALHDASDHLPVYADFVSLSSGGGGNISPLAEANGPYSGTSSSTITFSSAGSVDQDGSITSYFWDFGDGSTSSSANPTYSYLADGNYNVTLTVTDNNGASGQDVASVYISTSGGGGNGSVLFSEIFYDTPGTDSQEEWVELYNGSSSTVDLGGWTITDNNGSGSTYTIPGGTTIQASTHLTIAKNSTGFFAIYSYDADVYGGIPALNNGGDALLLRDGSGTMVDAVAWEGGASAGTPAGWGSSSAPSASTGNSIVRSSLSTDTDSFSDWATATGNGNPQTQPTAPPANTAPTAVANGPYSGRVNTAIAFSSAGSNDSDGTIASYLWNFGDGNTSTIANPSHSYASAGTYSVNLTVTDNDGATGQASTSADITVNTAPLAVANGPYTGTEGQSITFSSIGSSDSDGSISSYLWNFGDGNNSTSANPSHTYASVGSYSVTLTVTDNEGATGQSSTTATVDPVATSNSDILISEVFYDTPGTDSQEEWLELYNRSVSTIDLSGWTITDNNGTGTTYTIPTNTTIDASTHITIAKNSAGFFALYSYEADVYGGIPDLNNGGDALLLKDGSGALVDAVAWEGGASAGVPTGWGSATAPSAATGSSVVRTSLTSDTDSFNDWATASNNGNPETQPTAPPANVAPTAIANGPYTGTEGQSIAFSSSGSSDSDGTIASYLWDFGDGNTSTQANPIHAYTTAGSYTVSLIVTDNDGASGQASTTSTVDPAATGGSIQFTQGTLSGVGSSWQTVNLPFTYNSMVVVATPVYSAGDLPAIVRVRNATGNSFQVKVQNPSNAALSNYSIHYIALEEGVYTTGTDGVKMEAVKFTSTTTNYKGSWSAQNRSYQNSYASPVVLGQVMTENDPSWSVFWAHGSGQKNAPNSSNLNVGKHVGEDSDKTRANETVAYIVMESGNGTVETTPFRAGLGSDIVRGVTNAPPYNYSISGLSSAETATLSVAAMDGGDGGWPLLYGSNPLSSSNVNLAFDEDQIANSERGHTTEQVAYVVFGSTPAAKLVGDPFADLTETPTSIGLLQNYPNPFNPSTNIDFELTSTAQVQISVYNLLGQQVSTLVNEERPAGRHSVTFDAGNLSTGVYIYRMMVNGQVFTKKMLLAK